MVWMDKKGALVQRLISPAWSDDGGDAEAGFTLIDAMCVMAILALLAAIVVPTMPRATSKSRLESYAVATAALLKSDRNAALRRQTNISTEVDAKARLVRSGATGRVVQIPEDVTFEALLSARCDPSRSGSTIRFFSSGMSCGGVSCINPIEGRL